MHHPVNPIGEANRIQSRGWMVLFPLAGEMETVGDGGDSLRPVVAFVAAMVEANRIIYRDKDKVIPIMVAATQKPREAVEYAWDALTKACIWSS